MVRPGRPLKVAFLLAGLHPGGSERQMLALAEGLPRERFQVDFLARTGPAPMDARAQASGYVVRYLSDGTTRAGATRGTRARAAARRALAYARVARRERYDIVDAWLYPADMVAALLRHVTRTPVIISGRRNQGPRARLGPVDRPLEALLNRLTDAVVANSAAAAAYAEREQRADPAKLHIIRNGVEPIEPLGDAERAAIRSDLGARADDLVVGCVGNYREVKRHELLIDAFGVVARDRPDVRLVLVGEGPMRSRIEAQVGALGLSDRVRLHGSVLDPTPLYGAFDLFVQASRSEGLPNVLLEAAAAGCPIVATDAGGSAEIVIDGRTGLLVPIEDVGSLARAIARALDDPPLRARLGAEARRHMATTFGMDRFVREWADLYESLAAAKGVGRHG